MFIIFRNEGRGSPRRGPMQPASISLGVPIRVSAANLLAMGPSFQRLDQPTDSIMCVPALAVMSINPNNSDEQYPALAAEAGSDASPLPNTPVDFLRAGPCLQ